MDFWSSVAQEGRAAQLDSVLFDSNRMCILCTWEWEVPLAHPLSWSNNSCSYDLIFIECLLCTRHHDKVPGTWISSQNPLGEMDCWEVICQGYKRQSRDLNPGLSAVRDPRKDLECPLFYPCWSAPQNAFETLTRIFPSVAPPNLLYSLSPVDRKQTGR